jgi:hypothetical protein
MVVTITLTTAGADTGPFNLYSDVDGYTSAFEVGVSKAALLAGYTSYIAPNGTTIVRVMSSGTCTNYIDITLTICTTTTTTTIAGECASVSLTGGIGGGSWSATDCITLEPVGGDLDEGVAVDSGCIIMSTLSLSNVSASVEIAC